MERESSVGLRDFPKAAGLFTLAQGIDSGIELLAQVFFVVLLSAFAIILLATTVYPRTSTQKAMYQTA